MDYEVFKKWIITEANPWRIGNGLKPLDDLEIAKCFDILEKFHQTFGAHPDAGRPTCS